VEPLSHSVFASVEHRVKRLIFSSLAALALVAMVMPFSAPANARVAPEIRGTRCAKVGTSRTVKQVAYTCTKSGRSLVWQVARSQRGSVTTTTTTTTAAPAPVASTTSTLPPSSDYLGTVRIRGSKSCVRAGDQIEATGYFGKGNLGAPTISMARVFGGRDSRNGPVASFTPAISSPGVVAVTVPDISTLPNGDSTLNLLSVMFTWGPFTTAGIKFFSQFKMCTEFATTGTTVPLSNRTSLVRTMPNYNFNSGWLPDTNTLGYQYGHHTWSQIGQSFVFDRAMNLESLVFSVAAFTTVSDIDTYNRTPEPDNHAMENYDYVAEVPMRLRLTVWKSRNSAALLDDVETSRDVQMVHTQASDHVIVAQAPVEIVMSSPLALDPGSYLITIRLEATSEVVQRRILTLWVSGVHSGSATRGKYDRSTEKSCSYKRGTDIYPNGKAYKSVFLESYVDWRSAPNRNYSTLFTEHRAKVSDCIQSGNFADIFNEGDLVMELRGTWR